MNIVIGGFFHESNTFNPIVTNTDDFVLFHKDEIFENQNSYLMAKGIISYFKQFERYNILPTLFAKAVPNGEIDYDFYNKIKATFFKYLLSYKKVDAIVLALHGSMRIRNIGDAEGDLLKKIRRNFPNTPIICALDMHATITEDMINNANAFVGFKTAPHIDAYKTGFHAASIAHNCLENNLDLKVSYRKISFLIAGEKSETSYEPMRSLIDLLKIYEKDDEVLAASYCLGFPWADIKGNGVTALVVTKNDQNKADEVVIDLVQKFNESKNKFDFSVPAYTPGKAFEIALDQKGKLTFVSDSGDNPTAGSTGDNTTMLCVLQEKSEQILNANKKVIMAGMYDPLAVEFCKANSDKEIELTIGGIYDKKYCKPIVIKGQVKKIVLKWKEYESDLVLFSTKGYDLIITAKHIGFVHPNIFEALDVDYKEKDIIVIKLGYLTDAFHKVAHKSILALTPGCSNEVLENLDYTYREDYDIS